MSLDLPGFRRLSGGVIALVEIWPYDPDLARLDRVERRKMSDAQILLGRLSAGWRPGGDELDEAPIVHRWVIRHLAGKLIIVGIVSGHPHWPAPRLVGTSALIALNERLGWARTISRWYRLGRPDGAELAS